MLNKLDFFLQIKKGREKKIPMGMSSDGEFSKKLAKMCSSNICTLEKNEKQYIILLYFIHRKFQRISNPGIKRNTW